MFVSRFLIIGTICLIRSDPVSSPRELGVTAGGNATLQCHGPRHASITMIKWMRSDPKPKKNVIYFRDNHLFENYQHASFRGRVELSDPELKDGDASVILRNVTVSDAGTYECQVFAHSSQRRENTSHFVILTVTNSSHTDGNTEDGRDEKGYPGLVIGPSVGGALFVVGGVIVGCLIIIKCKKKRERIPAGDHQQL